MKTVTRLSDMGFHPAVDQWFHSQFTAPTLAQSRGWPHIQKGQHLLLAAPTGSGKTLAAFLAALDSLFRESLEGNLGMETRVLYVSPLKALSNDIHYNLSQPLAGIGQAMEDLGFGTQRIKAALRTGDTTAAERRSIIQKPPHILVTTPESFYLLLTSQSGRGVLKTVRTVIVDEIHALVSNRRGAHLALSLERLEALVEQPLQRIGLSATQSPMSLTAKILVGAGNLDEDGQPNCPIVDEGHLKKLDLALELPGSPLEAVMSNEVWEEVYNRIIELIGEHRTTLIFVNTRRLAERMTWHLAGKLSDEEVASHHGSLSLKIRNSVEDRLKTGKLKAMVATASMELGIDIGSVDLVCQIGSPRSISTLVQRVGRSGHHYGGVPKGRVFPITRDELFECVAMIRAVEQGLLDRLRVTEQPLDVLAQQIVAATACEDWDENHMYAMFRKAWLYRNLDRKDFDSLVHMLADGITTKRGRRGAWIYYDGVNGRIKARKGARLTALTNGGAIPDNADYRVVQEPQGTYVGSLNEDFAVESMPGDVFRLGNHSWRILKIELGIVRVEDAQGLPPSIPFWFGEAPGRTDELSKAVSDLRKDLDPILNDSTALNQFYHQLNLPQAASEQITAYLVAIKKALGVLPNQDHILMERFFDESGGMQLVIHAPFGSRLNRAWGLALRKRFCRSFNFELQAAATEDAIVLSLGPTHSFPLDDVFAFLSAETVTKVLVQALLDAPMFQTHWRWTAARALAVIRNRGGKKVPPNLQRMDADNLIAVVFPDQQACLENIAGDREIPDHPLITQTINDCLYEVMDADGLIKLLQGIRSGAIRCGSMDLPEPSLLAHEVLNAQPYAFLDDAPLEERRTRAVYLRRTLDPETIRDEGLLDEDAIETVRDQAWPHPDNADEAHDALIQLGGLPQENGKHAPWASALDVLTKERRAGLMTFQRNSQNHALFIAAEKLPLWEALGPISVTPNLVPPDRDRRIWSPEDACLELVRGFLECSGPITTTKLVEWFGLEESTIEAALLGLESEGMILRGGFDQGLEGMQWCNRRLLARIHHLTLHRLRSRIQPVTAHAFMRFLFQWQHVLPDRQGMGEEGLEFVLEQLEGFQASAGSWETDILPARVKNYGKHWLDQLCLQGRISWARITPPKSNGGGHFTSGPLKTTPISFFPRPNTDVWCAAQPVTPSSQGQQVLELLSQRGALFFAELRQMGGLLPAWLENALGELTALGLVSCDSFAGLRTLLMPTAIKNQRRHRGRRGAGSIEYAGRWFSLPGPPEEDDPDHGDRLEYMALTLLHRYGVVFRKMLDRESNSMSWRQLLYIYRHLEAVGRIRGGRFVEGFSGEQFALPEALSPLRDQREKEPHTALINLCGVDPLNLTGSIVPGPSVGQTPGNRILFSDGLPVAALDGGKLINWEGRQPPADAEHLLARHPHLTKV